MPGGVSPAEPFRLSPTQIASRVRTHSLWIITTSVILFWVRLRAFEWTADFRSWQWMRPLVRNEAKFEFLFFFSQFFLIPSVIDLYHAPLHYAHHEAKYTWY
jgi:hypothetical protein